ncbi:uncharacterized protein [Venturia canescens]|nr:uncharacterized protein LOC122417808 isoform X2 [Venturia canescens]
MTPVHVAAAWGRAGVLKLLLAHGGDPLCLDDEGRSPFHYAFDGAYYHIIAILGNYCTSNDINKIDMDERPNYKLTLDKILLNERNVIAEYMLSDNFPKSFVELETKSSESNKKNQCFISSDDEQSVSRSFETFNRLHNNVTIRRCYRGKSIPQFPVNLNSDKNFDEEKLLISNIIHGFSNGLAIKTGSTYDGNTYIRKRILESGNNTVSTKKTSRHKKDGDISIISKSPNLKLFTINDKTSNTKNSMTNAPLNLMRNYSIQTMNIQPKMKVRSAEYTMKSNTGSTRSRALTHLCLQESFRILDRKCPSSMQGEQKAKLQISDRFSDTAMNLRSPDTDFLQECRAVNKNKAKNLSIKLVDRMDDEYPEISSEVKMQSSSIPDNKENENKQYDHQKLDTTTYHETESIMLYKNKEKNYDVLENPESSNLLKVYSLEQKFNPTMNKNQVAKQAKILLEIDKAHKDRSPTLPASISFLENYENFYMTKMSHSDNSNNESSLCWIPHEAEPREISLWSHSKSFISVDEEYTYEDKEKGVAFIERHLRVIPPSLQEEMNRAKGENSWIDRLGELSIDTKDDSRESKTSNRIVKSTIGITDERELRDRLKAFGEVPGPITRTTFDVYLKRLWRLECKPVEDGNNKMQYNQKLSDFKVEKFACTIPKYLLVVDWINREDYYRNLEEIAFKEYAIANPERKYRGGTSKSSFCYLLLDPRLTQDLPRCGYDLTIEERWHRFLKAVFYVGKGKAARPAAHLYDAFKIWSSEKESRYSKICRKISRILEIWQSGQGVVCLNMFNHTMAEEACSREALMIEALGTNHLTNRVYGTYYGYTATAMNHEKKKSLGKFLLYKAMNILMHEGERQLFPRNVIL